MSVKRRCRLCGKRMDRRFLDDYICGRCVGKRKKNGGKGDENGAGKSDTIL